MKLKIISKSGVLPKYETEGAAGFDIRAYLKNDFILKSGERALVPTGLFFQIPKGYEAQVRARSGLAIRNGVGLVNGIGTVDSDYRGEIKVPLINWSNEDFTIHNGDRIAQVVINKYEYVEFEITDKLSYTERGEGGFGHTGV
ncbi:dUTP diphosphatase [Eubacterium nodatum ATCC 33099]|nr:dUTP diphosphatase [Eubacterium nodatum ATCC 33099]